MSRLFTIHIRDDIPLDQVAQITFKGIPLQTPLNDIDFANPHEIIGEGFIAGVGPVEPDNYPKIFDPVGRFLIGEQFQCQISFDETDRTLTQLGYLNSVRCTLNWLEENVDVALSYNYHDVILAYIGGKLSVNGEWTEAFDKEILTRLPRPYIIKHFPNL